MTETYQRNWEPRRRGRSAADDARTSYYGMPVIHKPHWKWLIIWYFFLGGLSSASYVIATIAELVGGHEGARIARAGRYVSLAALIPSPILLILDLGRPERFHHMLRVVKLRSPMSVGTWGLTLFGACSGVTALIQAARDGLFGRVPIVARMLLALPGKPISLLGGAFGFFVGGYTGVLLAATAVPLWARNALLLGPLFLSSALSSASAAITLLLAPLRGTSRHTLRRLGRLDAIVSSAELMLLVAVRVRAGPTIGRPLLHGRLRRVYFWGVLGCGIVAPLALELPGTLLRRAPWRGIALLAALLRLVGGFMLRYLIVMAGRASADDPEATFVYARNK